MFKRETKIFMIVGFVTLLGVSVLFVDHLSGTNRSSPAGPLDVDPLFDNGLVVSVPRTIEPRHAPTMPDPFRETIGNGIERLARGGEEIIDGAANHLSELRERVNPVPAAGRQSEPVPVVLEMGRPVKQDDNGQIVQPPEVQVHRVVAGDTLWRIAERYYGDPSLHTALAEYNRDRLTAAGQPRTGATLLIPPRALLVPGAAPTRVVEVTTPSTRPANQPQRQPTQATRMYEVKRGDTLSQISQRELGTSRRWREILELNADRLKEPTDIQVGMRLRLPAN